MQLTIEVCTAQHIGDREEQQDRVSILSHPHDSHLLLAVLADGMGGYTGGGLAAEQLIHTAQTNFNQFSPQAESPHRLLETCINEAHLLIKAMRLVNEKTPHSTAVMLLLQPGRATWAHCGDSRFYHFRNDQTVFCTKDHSYVEQLVSRGEITAEEALTHPNRNILLSSIGGEELPKITTGEILGLHAGDHFLLCSDGLWNYFSASTLAQTIAHHSARQAAEILTQQARAATTTDGDNLSLAIFKLK
jgi:serine/threonine protein phosphatase PrpC